MLMSKFKNAGFLYLAVFLLWLKAMLLSLFYFDFEIDNVMQIILLIINPIAPLLLFIGLGLFVKGYKRNRTIIWLSFILSFILVGDVAYYSFFYDFVTVPVLFMTQNFSDLGTSVKSMISWKTVIHA